MYEDLWASIAAQAQANWVTLAAAVVSVGSAFIAASQRRQEMRLAWNRELMTWAKEAMHSLAAARTLARDVDGVTPDALRNKFFDLRASFSASVDQGRLFFENVEGLRPRILDPLVCMVTLLERDPSDYGAARLAEIIDTHRSNFWRRTQKAAGTRWARKTVQAGDVEPGSGAHDFDEPTRDRD